MKRKWKRFFPQEKSDTPQNVKLFIEIPEERLEAVSAAIALVKANPELFNDMTRDEVMGAVLAMARVETKIH